jgi:5-methylthioadenosine/S-adenosylhomocysteine deaminase
MSSQAPIAADLLIAGATLITMNAERHVIRDGALAIRGDRIVAVGKRETLARDLRAKETIRGERFVVTPGFIDGHIHITGDPITRGFGRGGEGDSPSEILQRWVIPIFRAQTPAEEAVAAQFAALAMMRAGTTCFLEAGTISHLDAVMEALADTGIRGRTGGWVEGRAYNPADDQVKVSAAAIDILESEIARYPDKDGEAKLAAWPILVGHSTNSDEVWRAAKALADEHGLGVSAHMSPRASDPEWFLTRYNQRPLEHLDSIGVLGPNVAITHLANIDESELDILVRTSTNAIFCPHAALQGGFGISQRGLFPEMMERGVNVLVGSDGLPIGILESARLMARIFRDARCDQTIFPPTTILELATLRGAKALGLSHLIGSLEVGKKADFILHDTDTPEWGPVFDPVLQLALYAPSAVHSVWIDGARVVDDGHAVLLDEEKLLADARQAGADVIARTKLPGRSPWPVL